MMAPKHRRGLGIAVGVAVLAVLPLLVSEYMVTLLNYVGLATLVTLGLVLLTGVAGQTSFGQAGFVGIGAYASALLSTQYAVSPWLTLPIALVLAAVLAWLIGQITLRMSGESSQTSTRGCAGITGSRWHEVRRTGPGTSVVSPH